MMPIGIVSGARHRLFNLPAAWEDNADGREQVHRYLGGFYHRRVHVLFVRQ
jgi:hypothetical protein